MLSVPVVLPGVPTRAITPIVPSRLVVLTGEPLVVAVSVWASSNASITFSL
jgi:hypothetical protein